MITNFIDNNTVITASWLNKVDRAVSNAIGQGTDAPTTPAQVKQNLGLDNVDNTSDLNKPISTATQAAIDAEVATLEATDLLRVPRDSATGAASIPTGTTAERPASPVFGAQRANSTTGAMEWWNGTAWVNVVDTSTAVTLTGAQTLTNKTLTTPVINTNINYSGAGGTIQVNGVDKVTIGASGITAGSFAPNSIDAAAAALAFSGANQSLAVNGYQKLPSGLIIQWGKSAAHAGGATASVTFPVAFPNAIFAVSLAGSIATNSDVFDDRVVGTPSLSGVVFGSGASSSSGVYWIAIGY